MEEQKIIKDKPNSFEFEKAGNRWKLYFDSAQDLENQIRDLIERGFTLGNTVPLNWFFNKDKGGEENGRKNNNTGNK